LLNGPLKLPNTKANQPISQPLCSSFYLLFFKKKKKERKEREKGCGEKRSQRELKRRKNKWIKKMNVFFPFPFL